MTGERVGFLLRLVATIIDAVILWVVQIVVTVALGALGDAGAMLSIPINLIFSIGYFVYFWSSTGQTIGHKLLNLRVVRTDGSPLTMGNAFMRYIGWIVASIPLGIGFLWVLFDANKQGWHDKIASTYVVRA